MNALHRPLISIAKAFYNIIVGSHGYALMDEMTRGVIVWLLAGENKIQHTIPVNGNGGTSQRQAFMIQGLEGYN